MTQQKFPMTTESHAKLSEELESLIKNDREAIKTAIAEARELGDLKENAEYHAAKEKQSMLEGRISEIQGKLNNAQVIDVSTIKEEKIVFGATVDLIDSDTEEAVTYQIVGEDEAKESKVKISYNSPIAKALIGKEEGDEVVVKAPKGDVNYEISSVVYK